jgi:hypothetical protein
MRRQSSSPEQSTATWPLHRTAFAATLDDHLEFLKTWLAKRVAWMDDPASWDALASWGDVQ